MKTIFRKIKLLTVTLTLLAGTNLIAGDKPSAPEIPPAQIEKAWQRRISELRADGIPLEEIVRLLRDNFPELNFIVKEKVRAETVAFTLRSVTLEEIFKALEPATEGRVQVIYSTNRNDRLIVFDRTQLPARVDPSTGLPFSPGDGRKICRVFNLSEYLVGRSDKEVDEAIAEIKNVLETAWSMLRNANNQNEQIPTVSVHRGTRLLVVVGSPEDLAIVQDVVIGLQGSAPGVNVAKPVEPTPNPRSKPEPGKASRKE
jgi:hypothetical protein